METLDLFSTAPVAASASVLGDFAVDLPVVGEADPLSLAPELRQRALGQYMTPAWLAQAIVERHFGDLKRDAFGVEPSCGDGRFLGALPRRVRAVGCEIDPSLAAKAEIATGRRVICKSFYDLELRDLGDRPDFMIGNPPFTTTFLDAILAKGHQWLPAEGRVGLIIPCSMLQTASRVARYNEDWSIEAEMIPRNVYKGLELPLSVVQFRKDKRRVLIGLAMYAQARDVELMPALVRDLLVNSHGTWGDVVAEAIKAMGGKASLTDIYQYVSPKKPTGNPHWQAQIRKVVRQSRFVPVERGVYEIAASTIH